MSHGQSELMTLTLRQDKSDNVVLLDGVSRVET